MEKSQGEASKLEQMKQKWIKDVSMYFQDVLKAQGRELIADALERLNIVIKKGILPAAISKTPFSSSNGIQGEHALALLSAQLEAETSPKARKEILLVALAEKENCNLEEEYLKILREMPLDAKGTRKLNWH